MEYIIRPATLEDADQLLMMVQALAIHLEGSIENFNATRFLNDAFGADPQFSLLVASEEKGPLLGYTLFHDSYESSYAERGVYIADLFVAEETRGHGLGTLLLQAVVKDAKERGRTFVWLVTPSEESRLFYNKKMNIEEKVVAFALTGDDFKRMTAG